MRTSQIWMGLLVASFATGACNQGAATPAAATSEYQLVGTIKDIMEDIVDPASDVLFESVATDITADGILERRPQNDEEWHTVEASAMNLVEAANLLKMPGRLVAAPGENTKSSEGADAPELSAEEIAAKIDADRGRFIRYANELQGTSIKLLDATRRKDPDALFALGEELDLRCENCHIEYWYPNDPFYTERKKELESVK